MIDDWKGLNIDIDEVERLTSENLYGSSEDDFFVSNLSTIEKIEDYKIFDFLIYEDTYEIEEIVKDYFVLTIIFKIIFKTELNYSEGNSKKRIIKYYIGESHLRYLLHKEEIVGVKIMKIDLTPDSIW